MGGNGRWNLSKKLIQPPLRTIRHGRVLLSLFVRTFYYQFAYVLLSIFSCKLIVVRTFMNYSSVLNCKKGSLNKFFEQILPRITLMFDLWVFKLKKTNSFYGFRQITPTLHNYCIPLPPTIRHERASFPNWKWICFLFSAL